MKKFFNILLVCMILHILFVDAQTITVVIASESPCKIAAIKASFHEKFLDDDLIFLSYKTISGIPEQPVGIISAMQGIYNRLLSLPDHVSADYIVVIENYIEQSATTQRWYDKAVVVIKQGAQEIVMESKAVYIPDVYVELAQQMSDEIFEYGYATTIGMAIQKTLNDRVIDPCNWHQEHEFGGVPRGQILQDAIDKILYAEELQFLKSFVLTYSDFPKPGITFANFLPIVQNAQAFELMISMLAQRYRSKNINVIVGLESRGFILGAALAYELGISFVPVRKPGKLPGATYSVSYEKEYGFDTLVIAQDALQQGQRVLIIDDLIATGGSARAAIELVCLAGGEPVEFVSLLQVAELAEQAVLPIASFNLID